MKEKGEKNINMSVVLPVIWGAGQQKPGEGEERQAGVLPRARAGGCSRQLTAGPSATR